MVGVGGVDAADQRVDEPLVDLVAEPGPDEPPDRVVVDRRARAAAARSPRATCRATTAASSWPAGRGAPADRAAGPRGSGAGRRTRPPRRPAPATRGRRPGRRRGRGSSASGTRARNASAPASTWSTPANGGAVDPSADTVGRLEHRDVAVRRRGDLEGGGEPGDPATDDGDAPASRSDAIAVTERCGRCVDRRRSTRSASAAMTAGSSLTLAVRSKARPAWRGPGGGLDVEVVQDLEVVGDEPAGAHDHAAERRRRRRGRR